ncbi:MAG: serine/threonine-protein kinase, partial [Myxococcota bacterium]
MTVWPVGSAGEVGWGHPIPVGHPAPVCGSLTAVAGIPFGPYILVRRLAMGGMAEIFLARREGPEGFARELVVKRILPHLAQKPEFTSMFFEEARVAARLTHPNVVQVFDFGQVDGAHYIVMELVRGVDLRGLINRARELAMGEEPVMPGELEPQKPSKGIPPFYAAAIASFMCEGLAHAHALRVDGKLVGLVHRDVTPSNVLLSFDGSVKIADFGIAKSNQESTDHGIVKGKYTYMSPEQARGEALDARSDIFNVGILLFESVLGQMLFPPHDARLAKRLTARGQIPGPDRLHKLPPGLRPIVRRALSAERNDRYPDALRLRADLAEFLRRYPQPAGQVELGKYVRSVFPDVLEEDRRAPRAAGTVPVTVAERSISYDVPVVSFEPVIEHTILDDDADATLERSIPTVVQPRRRSLLWPSLAALGMLAVGLLTVFALLVTDDSPPVAPSEPPPEPPSEPPPAPVRRAIVPAELRVESEPLGLELYIDGAPAGPTPTIVSLEPDRTHRIELRREDRVVASEEISVTEGEVRELALTGSVEDSAGLQVLSDPSGASVRIDGRSVGDTPLEVDLAPGTYEVTVQRAGYRGASLTARLSEAGRTYSHSVELEREATMNAPVRGSGTLVIATHPWSDVFLS